MANPSKLRIGTRRSRLALAQAHWVQSRVEALGISTEVVEIVSEGDRKLGQPLYAIENAQPGLFTKELQRALAVRDIDIAVHSLKDLPTQPTPPLEVIAISERASVEDCLVSSEKAGHRFTIKSLPAGARVGTSSLRREAQLLDARPDLKILPIRGNILTRIKAVQKNEFDAIVLARAGLERVEPQVTAGMAVNILDPEIFVPAPGQGALAIESYVGLKSEWREAIVQKINRVAAQTCTRIERRILRELEGGCTLPLGVWCSDLHSGWRIRAFLGESTGQTQANRRWTGFHRFDISGPDEQVLVAKTVQHFRAKGLSR